MALHILVRRNYGGKSLVSIKCYSFRSFNFLLTLKDFNCILSTGTISIDLQKVFDTIDHNTSVVSQKGESQNGCFKKTKHVKFSQKRTFLTPCFVFLKLPF